MMEYKSKDTYEHPLLSSSVATLPKNHSLWCSHPGIIGLAPLPASVHSPGGDTCISQSEFPFTISLILFYFYLKYSLFMQRWGQSICFKTQGMMYVSEDELDIPM
jgi:hypothetical protein